MFWNSFFCANSNLRGAIGWQWRQWPPYQALTTALTSCNDLTMTCLLPAGDNIILKCSALQLAGVTMSPILLISAIDWWYCHQCCHKLQFSSILCTAIFGQYITDSVILSLLNNPPTKADMSKRNWRSFGSLWFAKDSTMIMHCCVQSRQLTSADSFVSMQRKSWHSLPLWKQNWQYSYHTKDIRQDMSA